ncbi:class 1 fructose-bisphosphatase [Roseospira navarrensis]|uniref:Fructose-1,6-bisphosphatase class 1 n=1 Tax=Roseospira navarrensis TaxID=140058 RepID=A0A7X2D539_9PROT|nr:class 1 fructose-bisphosphatase [Roseospira navarrensis]MQX37282.1 class 1 fructose-bisphosphatase [Roseospira navarrensis]
MSQRDTLQEWLDGQVVGLQAGQAVADAILALADGARRITALIRQGHLLERDPDEWSIQTVLEDGANTILREVAESAPVAHYASEDHGDVIVLDSDGPLALAVDPLDGASHLDANVVTGTIFSLYPKAADPVASFVRSGRDLLVAGYAMYGPRTVLVLTLGHGAAKFTLDPATDRFLLTQPTMKTPEDADKFAINAANYRHWEPPVRAYIDDCIEGRDGPRDKDFRMRWASSLVAEAHRILTLGGVFLYPRDSRPGRQKGTLRRVFDAVPIAMIAEQCGAAATDGARPILDAVPEGLHDRAPLVFGSRMKVERVQRYHQDPDFATDAAPLFGVRGLFRG